MPFTQIGSAEYAVLQLQRADDLGLPPRTVIVRRDYFSPEESELYRSLFTDAKREFSTFVDAGTVLNSERMFLMPLPSLTDIFL